ncbi:hypothetical protein [Methylobacter sp. YRD-M1]|uniref:hypothetical protein n=1 Tax=Methylobacter sp. YRD-M1 TaxID=2911520 RepID=UPI00227AEB94|nr:hypothetical protein [Methylobacter sp. YRD-M1]WAK01354.1 hypothetical protein LZ558_16195 [Methylobacter sp. YRD-M1]
MEQGKLQKLLTELGLFLGPASLVGLAAPVADISSRDTAILSFATIILISLCHYRQKINSTIPSALALAVLFTLALLYYFTYDNILLKDTGLIRFYKKSNDYLAEVSKFIADAHDEVLFFGTNFHITAEDRREELLSKLNEGLDIKFLVMDPYSQRLGMLATDFDSDVENLKKESMSGLEDLVLIEKRWSEFKNKSSNPGTFEVRLFDTSPKMRGYFFDANSAKGKAYLVPYANKLNSPQAPGFLFEMKKDGVAGIYLTGIKKLWQEAVPLDKFLEKHRRKSNLSLQPSTFRNASSAD